jgi:probable HAF family extracellular repeat protein
MTMFAKKFLSIILLLAPLAAVATPTYSVTVVGPANSTASGINEHGQVIGTFADASSLSQYGFIAGAGFFTLGPLGGNSAPSAINDSGAVVGHASGSASNFGVAFSEGPGGSMNFFNPFGGFHSQATGINNAGQIVGWGDDFTTNHSFLLSGGAVKDLGTLGGTWSEANAINNGGQVAGASSLADENLVHAYLYSYGGMTDLGTLGGMTSRATGINDDSAVVGVSTVDAAGHSNHAFLYSHGAMTDLGTLGGDESDAAGINNLGQVVGRSSGLSFDGTHGFLFTDGVMLDLNAMIDPASGWTIVSAADINNEGQIAAYGVKDGVGYALRLELASAVPEPGTASMLLIGLGLLAFSPRRKTGARIRV